MLILENALSCKKRKNDILLSKKISLYTSKSNKSKIYFFDYRQSFRRE